MGKTSEYLTFQISGQYFAILREQIREMMPVQPLLPARSADPPEGQILLGLLQSHGREIPVFNIRRHLGLEPRETARSGCLLVLSDPSGLEYAFPVDKITDCISVHPLQIGRGVITGHGRQRAVVNAAELVGHEAILSAAFSSNSTSSG